MHTALKESAMMWKPYVAPVANVVQSAQTASIRVCLRILEYPDTPTGYRIVSQIRILSSG